MTHPFYRLAPYIQEFIYREKWGELRPIQVDALSAILDTPNHILITSGTASGKTEAAFLPILTELYERPSDTIGAMYVGPLKALINDQFERLTELLEDADLPVQSWHGDVSQSKKDRFLRHGRGILQITPESLEAMLINRSTELRRLFGDLRYVILDEVHALIGSDRGRQVLCQLQRLARYQVRPSRRVGLSATLGEPELAATWLAGGTDIPVMHVRDTSGKRDILLGLEHFIVIKDRLADEGDEPLPLQAETAPALPSDETTKAPENPMVDESDELFAHMSSQVRASRKTLIFANSRNDTEEIIHNLRRIAGVEGLDEDGYHVHHGSISSAFRERAEQDLRDPAKSACVAATVTLELGIDIGCLDQVLQLNATNTVSSFVQRLGRSGRRGGAAKMFFYTSEEDHEPNATLGELIPWGLLQTIATIQLYIEEKWIEPPYIPKLPMSLLYHQTMSIILAQTELIPADLAERVLRLSPFQHITFDQYRTLLRHLIAINHLQQVEGGGLIIGSASERLVNNYHFYATFEGEKSYTVREGTREIGTIQSLPDDGERFRLAGRAWKMLSMDEEKQIIQVERVKGRAETIWMGRSAIVHTRILERIRRILEEDTEYRYLHPRALRRLQSARQLAQASSMTAPTILDLGGRTFMLLPWAGTREMETIKFMLAHVGIVVKSDKMPYYIMLEAESLDLLQHHIDEIRRQPPSVISISQKVPTHILQNNKFDRYIPESLLRAAFASDVLDFNGAVAGLGRITDG